MTLSSKQKEILQYIIEKQEQKGYPPSVREICEAVNLRSTSTVHGHLARLESKGYIKRDPAKPRAIEICKRPDQELPQETKPFIPWSQKQRRIHRFTILHPKTVLLTECLLYPSRQM